MLKEEVLKKLGCCQICGSKLESVDLSHGPEFRYEPEHATYSRLIGERRLLLRRSEDIIKIVCPHCGVILDFRGENKNGH